MDNNYLFGGQIAVGLMFILVAFVMSLFGMVWAIVNRRFGYACAGLFATIASVAVILLCLMHLRVPS